jgi:hypothetical protein
MLYNYHTIGLLPIDTDCKMLIKQLFGKLSVKVVSGPPVDLFKQLNCTSFVYENDKYKIIYEGLNKYIDDAKKIIDNCIYYYISPYFIYSLSLCIKYNHTERHGDTL